MRQGGCSADGSNVKRAGNLFNGLISYDNLLSAFKKAYRGCSKSYEAMRFRFNLENELLLLRDALQSGHYQHGRYRIFRVHDPKERTISVAPFRDRVVHHAIVNILEPIFERIFIHDSYATRKGKGTHRAIKRVQTFLKQNEWYFRTDVEKYFDSVRHNTLISIVERKIKDREMLSVIEKTIMHGGNTGRGLPIGNLTSQFFANVYLDPLDHYVKDHLRVKHYVRYMDDMVILAGDSEYLKEMHCAMHTFLYEKLGLCMKEKSTYINRRSNGISFLGARIFPCVLRLGRKNLVRSLRKLKEKKMEYISGSLPEQNFTESLTSIAGHLVFFNTHRLMTSCGQALFRQ